MVEDSTQAKTSPLNLTQMTLQFQKEATQVNLHTQIELAYPQMQRLTSDTQWEHRRIRLVYTFEMVQHAPQAVRLAAERRRGEGP